MQDRSNFLGTYHDMTCGHICLNFGLYPSGIGHGIYLVRDSQCELKHRIFIIED